MFNLHKGLPTSEDYLPLHSSAELSALDETIVTVDLKTPFMW